MEQSLVLKRKDGTFLCRDLHERLVLQARHNQPQHRSLSGYLKLSAPGLVESGLLKLSVLGLAGSG